MNHQVDIPARRILSSAMEVNPRLGHENLGFLSSSSGFMPSTPPFLALPAAYTVWDEYGERLPEFYRDLTLRSTFDKMPLLRADAAHLPDKFLLRASVLMGFFAHAYYYIEPTPPAALPASIQQPWQDITKRLKRKAPHLSYIDMAIYNWQFIDKAQENPLNVDNMRPLVSVWGNETERYFLMTIVDILIRSSPLVEAVVHAQEAVSRDDVPALIQELRIITDCINQITYDSLPKTDLNAYSKYYTDPVVWGKTVAPFSPPIRPEAPAPAGAATPSLQILDAFFGRKSYESQIGDVMTLAREWYPKHWLDFYHAVQEISVLDYIHQKADAVLYDAYREALHAYVGESSFMERHRMKIYGYTEIAFKVGRAITGRHMQGGLKERPWDKVDDALDISRRERFKNNVVPTDSDSYYGKVISISDISRSGQAQKVVLDVIGRTVRYQPGDRCAILPENSDELVQKTLRALNAQGHETIRLDPTWQDGLNLHKGYQSSETLPLQILLKFGRLRPVKRSTANLLYRLTQNSTLKKIVESHTEEALEVWDLLEMVTDEGFNPRTLWMEHESNLKFKKDEAIICQLIPPEKFRMYSISSIMTEEERGSNGASRLSLTVGRLQYQTDNKFVSERVIPGVQEPLMRHGTASNFLTTETEKAFALKIVHPPRFHLPKDRTRPIVMFAGGTGISPFRSFIHERVQHPDTGENWLFLGTRTQDDFYYQEELECFVAQKQLNLRVAFSREDICLHDPAQNADRHFVFEAGRRHRIDEAILSDKNIHRLWSLLRSPEEDGLGAYIYVCGRAGFAKSVMQAVMTIFERFHHGNRQEKRDAFYRMVAEGRYMQDVFTTYTPPHTTPQNLIHISEVAQHNNEQDGYWLIINHCVYDLSEFIQMHPGGFHILRNYVGMDATWAYQKVRHHLNPEVQAMLDMYKIGIIRPLTFSQSQAQMMPEEIDLQTLYARWVNTLYVIMEMENALYTFCQTASDIPSVTSQKYRYRIGLRQRIGNRYA